MLCGSSCVKYILEKNNIDITNLNGNMNWISELAIEMNKHFDVELLCYKSNLFDDFNDSNDYSFDGFKYLKESKDLNISIKELKLNKKELINELNNNDYIILCVESAIFNNDNSMSGGHFIILNGISDNMVNIINPIKEKYEYRKEKINNIIKYCKNYGSWRLLIKERI